MPTPRINTLVAAVATMALANIASAQDPALHAPSRIRIIASSITRGWLAEVP